MALGRPFKTLFNVYCLIDIKFICSVILHPFNNTLMPFYRHRQICAKYSSCNSQLFKTVTAILMMIDFNVPFDLNKITKLNHLIAPPAQLTYIYLVSNYHAAN